MFRLDDEIYVVVPFTVKLPGIVIVSLPSPNVTLPKLALSAAATCAEPECTPSPNLDKNVPLNCD